MKHCSLNRQAPILFKYMYNCSQRPCIVLYNLQEAMKNAKELIEEEERDRKKAEKRRAKKKVCFSFDTLLHRNYPQGESVFFLFIFLSL